MERRWLIYGGGVVVIALLVLFVASFVGNEVDEEAAPEAALVFIGTPIPSSVPIITMPGIEKTIVNFERYNYDFVDENVKSILNSMLGPSGKTAFYLPATGYINVSRGSKYGVAFALNNPNPSGENYFEYDWTAGSEDCEVGLDVVQSWIEMGWMSFGKIGEGWIDHMTVYFSFPSDVDACSVRYDFVVTKDGVFYDSKSVLFNLI